MWYLFTLVLTVSPIFLGGGYWLFEYVKEEFYKTPLYPEQ